VRTQGLTIITGTDRQKGEISKNPGGCAQQGDIFLTRPADGPEYRHWTWAFARPAGDLRWAISCGNTCGLGKKNGTIRENKDEEEASGSDTW
jgi:hypothetical protein